MNDNSTKQPLKELTKEELDFAKFIASGDGQRTAYKKAFPHRAHWKISALDPEASHLAKDPRVSQEIAVMRDELSREYFLSFETKRALIKDKIEDPNISERDRTRYIELDNKMAGHYAPTKVEQSGELNLNHSISPEISEALDNIFGK